nr:hypothetical protein [Bacteroidota bacterium]
MRTKYLFLVFALNMIFSFAFGQYDAIKDGAYRNVIDFHKSNSLCDPDFNFYEVEDGVIENFFVVRSNDRKIRRRKIIKDIWCIKIADTIYFNAKRIGMLKAYIKLSPIENYIYFHGIPQITKAQRRRMNHAVPMWGMVGYMLAGIKADNENEGKEHYVLNLKTGATTLFTRQVLKNILKSYPDLYNSYIMDPHRDSLDVMKRYLEKCNNLY